MAKFKAKTTSFLLVDFEKTELNLNIGLEPYFRVWISDWSSKLSLKLRCKQEINSPIMECWKRGIRDEAVGLD